MHITLCATEEGLAEAFKAATADLANVDVFEGSIFDVECDAMVSPANSFGIMDGGIDRLYVQHFGAGLQDAVRKAILQERHGELLVGDALIVATADANVPYMIAAPTMRVPMRLVPETVNPYLAARAVLLAVRHGTLPCGSPAHQSIKRVAWPGFGTGVGAVPFEIAAHQMREAIIGHRDKPASLPTSWAEASFEHQCLYTNEPRDLQRSS